MKISDLVRDYARQNYIDPARHRRAGQVRIVAGEVHRGLRFTNRLPLVCSALASKAFLQENRLRLISREGPPSGTSTTVVFTYSLGDGETSSARQSLGDWVRSLRGAGKETFAALGGGEGFIRSEREQWNASEAEAPERSEANGVRVLSTPGVPRAGSRFSYSGSIAAGVTVHDQSGDVVISDRIFRAALTEFSGRSVYGGFWEDDPPAGGFGEWIARESPRLNARALTSRHASQIAAILCAEAGVRSSLDGSAVVLHFPRVAR